jgi:hypothetical protein
MLVFSHYYSTLEMEPIFSSETSTDFRLIIRHYIRECMTLQISEVASTAVGLLKIWHLTPHTSFHVTIRFHRVTRWRHRKTVFAVMSNSHDKVLLTFIRARLVWLGIGTVCFLLWTREWNLSEGSELLGFWTWSIIRYFKKGPNRVGVPLLHLRTGTKPISETLCSLVLRIPDDGKVQKLSYSKCYTPSSPLTVAARSKAWTVFVRSNAGVVGSNPTRGMDVCVRLFCVYAVLCVGRGLDTGWSPVQGVLPTVYVLGN